MDQEFLGPMESSPPGLPVHPEGSWGGQVVEVDEEFELEDEDDDEEEL